MDWSLIEAQRFETVGAVTAASTGTLMTGGAANTKGAYAEVVASTAFDAHGLLVSLSNGSSSYLDYLTDVAVGASGSETIIAENLYAGSGDGAQTIDACGYLLPISIPAGTRLSARVQSSGASATLRILIILLGEGFITPPGLGRITTYGASTADSGGTQIDPGGTAHTKGAYSEIVASTTNPIRQLTIAMGNQANVLRTTALWLADLAVGAAGAEQVLIENIMLNCGGSVDLIQPQIFPPLGVNIPAGTRLAARAQCSIIDVTDRLIDIFVYGVD